MRSRLFGGDAPFSKVVPSVVAGLEGCCWLSSSEPIAVKRIDGAGTASCPVTPIGVEGMPTDDLSFCPTDRTVRWRQDAIRSIYDEVGDFAVATLFAELWATVKGDHPWAETAVSPRRAICLAGDWARAQYDATPHGSSDEMPTYKPVFGTSAEFVPPSGHLTLSPGDLDEAVQSLLGAGSAARSTVGGGPFARVDAFRVGFFQRSTAC